MALTQAACPPILSIMAAAAAEQASDEVLYAVTPHPRPRGFHRMIDSRRSATATR